MATISFGTNVGTNADDVLGGRVLYDPMTDHYTLENVVLGRGGNDSIQSMILPVSVDGQLLSFNSTLDGGAGNDVINGNSASDFMFGGSGDDAISGDGLDQMFGGLGVDSLFLNSEASSLDLILSYAVQAAAQVTLSNGSVIGGFEKFVLVSAAGNDTADLSGDAKALDSNFQTGAGNDTLIVDSATRGSIEFTGGAGVDTLTANLTHAAGAVTFEPVGVGGQLSSTGLNVFCSEVEQFILTTGAANDSLSGGDFSDQFAGGTGRDSLSGNGGADTLNGQGGSDEIFGGAGRDSLVGGAGNDTMTGGADSDTLVGGAGADVFVYASVADSGFGATADRIRDFVEGVDRISLTQIVADPAANPDPGFAFVSAFSGLGAQVRAVQDALHNTTVIEGRLAGDAVTDFTIILTGLHSLTAGDFLL